MQKSSKIAWTIVTLLIGGIIIWNLDTASTIGRIGYATGLAILAVIYVIWRWDSKEEKKDK